ncbi:hypothetical protein BATDEDRAFT_85968 [Batrachochytrium dendrobatidis JAM81]|uniref:ASX DEUBAD domain-containing protein n=1 Tax=Batrachochytrium dendrobatidis (strain JAM81 / FGSC 10211) TaxID=684364 RepID=F4NTM3_BATDJ|nr:uncharacterized protein BATDEDRAFT_85968 [Batrachochytrium dendrobatidis JAM81]EGF83528.1 hypothetical protein BATDEDRAFT_85968 [Batrachochytrium dendrobatidis JAM81]|eukprot:XP_006676128.1 hypothetical protein BATDEDRAFT_85968 [Batrachochytrium dendrobatidis JAM81]
MVNITKANVHILSRPSQTAAIPSQSSAVNKPVTDRYIEPANATFIMNNSILIKNKVVLPSRVFEHIVQDADSVATTVHTTLAAATTNANQLVGHSQSHREAEICKGRPTHRYDFRPRAPASQSGQPSVAAIDFNESVQVVNKINRLGLNAVHITTPFPKALDDVCQNSMNADIKVLDSLTKTSRYFTCCNIQTRVMVRSEPPAFRRSTRKRKSLLSNLSDLLLAADMDMDMDVDTTHHEPTPMSLKPCRLIDSPDFLTSEPACKQAAKHKYNLLVREPTLKTDSKASGRSSNLKLASALKPKPCKRKSESHSSDPSPSRHISKSDSPTAPLHIGVQSTPQLKGSKRLKVVLLSNSMATITTVKQPLLAGIDYSDISDLSDHPDYCTFKSFIDFEADVKHTLEISKPLPTISIPKCSKPIQSLTSSIKADSQETTSLLSMWNPELMFKSRDSPLLKLHDNAKNLFTKQIWDTFSNKDQQELLKLLPAVDLTVEATPPIESISDHHGDVRLQPQLTIRDGLLRQDFHLNDSLELFMEHLSGGFYLDCEQSFMVKNLQKMMKIYDKWKDEHYEDVWGDQLDMDDRSA